MKRGLFILILAGLITILLSSSALAAINCTGTNQNHTYLEFVSGNCAKDTNIVTLEIENKGCIGVNLDKIQIYAEKSSQNIELTTMTWDKEKIEANQKARAVINEDTFKTRGGYLISLKKLISDFTFYESGAPINFRYLSLSCQTDRTIFTTPESATIPEPELIIINESEQQPAEPQEQQTPSEELNLLSQLANYWYILIIIILVIIIFLLNKRAKNKNQRNL